MQTWDPEFYDRRQAFVSRYGEDLVGLLDPKAGERVLDVGCGTGHLTARIARMGAATVGIDRSPAMVEAACRAYPDLQFLVGDAADFRFEEPFDAVFSNAALHWVRDARSAARCMAAALRPGGRLVAELGGRGNIQALLGALEDAIAAVTGTRPQHDWYYPSLAEYAAVLEEAGLEVRWASLYDRPTPLEGADGLRDWVRGFRAGWLQGLSQAQQAALFGDLEDRLRLSHWHDGRWQADYRRLRVVAAAPA